MKTIFKIFIALGLTLALPGFRSFCQISVNNDLSAPDASAMLDVKSTTGGLLMPRMTASQRTAIVMPVDGLMVYQTDGTAGFYFYNGFGWIFMGTTEGYSGNVTDVDGNVYPTVKIGNQEWMAQNLRATHNALGDPITKSTNSFSWISTTEGAYCWYGYNEAANKTQYGALYNWYAVNGSNGTPGFHVPICPTGWHVPTDTEWNTLITWLGGAGLAGGKMKQDLLWNSPNTGATNESGFSARPGGITAYNGPFSGMLDYGNFWTATELNTTDAHYVWLVSNAATATPTNTYSKKGGFSVRCVKD